MPIPKQHFYFLRHGQTDWNVEGRFQGHTDMPLNAAGVLQAHDAAQTLAGCPVDVIVASPLVRALKTAAIVAERLDKPLFVDSEGTALRRVRRSRGQRGQGEARRCPARTAGPAPAA